MPIKLWLRTLADLTRSLPVQIAREVGQDVRHTLRLWRRVRCTRRSRWPC